jgi:MFS family permease
VRPRGLLMAGMAVLVAADILLSREIGLVGLSLGVLLWGAHMGLTQGVLSRMVADVAPPRLVATSFGAFHFVSGIGVLLASLAAGWLWDREGASAAFLAGAGAAAVALAMLSLLPEDERRTA